MFHQDVDLHAETGSKSIVVLCCSFAVAPDWGCFLPATTIRSSTARMVCMAFLGSDNSRWPVPRLRLACNIPQELYANCRNFLHHFGSYFDSRGSGRRVARADWPNCLSNFFQFACMDRIRNYCLATEATGAI